jgi:hypothetical protein
MNRTVSLTGRSIRRLHACLATIAMALGAGVLAMAGTAGPAQAATASTFTPTPIAINTVNWSGSAGFGSRQPAWYKDGSGVIHLQGAVTQISTGGTGANLIGTLPAAARPASNVFTVVHTFNGTYADLAVQTNGQIGLIDPRPPAVRDYTFVSLEGISYRPTNATPITSIGINWSPFAGSGSRVPAWFKDRSGVIHLQGAVTQTSAGSNLIATLPTGARPASAVFTVVHTFNGTYADLAIQTNGQILAIDPRPPAVKDYTFLSLEGITYHR